MLLSFAWYSPCTWLIISWESPKTWIYSAPIWWARVRPAIMASYTLSLLVSLKLHLMALEAVSLIGEVSTIPTPDPLTLLDLFSLFLIFASEAYLLLQSLEQGRG